MATQSRTSHAANSAPMRYYYTSDIFHEHQQREKVDVGITYLNQLQWGYVGLGLMLFIMVIFSPLIVSLALRQTKQDIPEKKDKDHSGHKKS